MFEVFRKYLDSRISLTDEQFDRITSVATLKKLRKKQYLLQQGDVWRFNAFIQKGCVRVYTVDDKGLEHVLSFAQENWWTGDRESLLTGNPAKFNVDAIEDSEIVLIAKPDFDLICKEIPVFNDMVHDIIQRSFVASQNRIHASISYTAEEKYLDFVKKYPDFAVRIPQHMIASYLGVTAETLSRVRKVSAKK
ncbi:Crp/Fnr family transcriptional regulator [Mucilaginibacter agri]|uniref:Cyclic nucleotide-binding domain-containing protein n=1 Tax=Mucilaginibacter agri TaxID=2695265 RepID=A0A965ZI27_9SPHI|nr:Crp/Fnr family transcriptional regulator [Mucilaginibacter agri]NCD70112.1 cyclic nucleotide-binding domain-containing protein [Mucilaginibacter agri]